MPSSTRNPKSKKNPDQLPDPRRKVRSSNAQVDIQHSTTQGYPPPAAPELHRTVPMSYAMERYLSETGDGFPAFLAQGVRQDYVLQHAERGAREGAKGSSPSSKDGRCSLRASLNLDSRGEVEEEVAEKAESSRIGRHAPRAIAKIASSAEKKIKKKATQLKKKIGHLAGMRATYGEERKG